MRSTSQSFFQLRLETKEKLGCKMNGHLLSGYGFYYGSNKTKPSRRNWSEGLALETQRLGEFSSLLWPDDRASQLEFCATIEDYNAAMKELASRLLRLLLNSCGVPEDYEKYAPKEPPNLRLNHYPPCPTPSQAVGLQHHKDSDLFTILLQAGTVSGSQVLNNDRWVPVHPEPEAFTLNVGTVLQVLSNGLYESALHRDRQHVET